MTEKERRRRQQKIKARRRKQLLHHLLVGGSLLLILIIVVAAVAIPEARAKKAENAGISEEALATAEVLKFTTPEPEETAEPEPTSHPYNSYNYDPSDRSNFAVNPEIPCGTGDFGDEKVVYLTLDDGPSYLTPAFLDLLDEYGIKATFFVTGQNPEYFYLIKEAYDRGHTIGLHTYCHDYATIYASPEAFFNDLDQIGAVVAEQIGYVPCFIRFSGGSANYISHDYTPGIMTYLTQEVQNRGYQYFDWNCSSGDGRDDVPVEELVAAATSSEWDTTVLLSHDASGKEATLEALPQIIEFYLNNGFEFRPITRESYTSHQEIFN